MVLDVLEEVPEAVFEDVLEEVPETVLDVALDVLLLVSVPSRLAPFIFTIFLPVPTEEREEDESVLVREDKPVKDVFVRETLLLFVLGAVLLA